MHQSESDDDILSTDDDDQEKGVSGSEGGVVEEDKLDEDIEDVEEMDEGISVSTAMVKGWVRESTKVIPQLLAFILPYCTTTSCTTTSCTTTSVTNHSTPTQPYGPYCTVFIV